MTPKNNTRPLVAFELNGRVYRWLLAPMRNAKLLDMITIEIPMRHYPKKNATWVVRQMLITFVKKTRTLKDIVEVPKNFNKNAPPPPMVSRNTCLDVEEVYYACISTKMFYEDGCVPVAKSM